MIQFEPVDALLAEGIVLPLRERAAVAAGVGLRAGLEIGMQMTAHMAHPFDVGGVVFGSRRGVNRDEPDISKGGQHKVGRIGGRTAFRALLQIAERLGRGTPDHFIAAPAAV